MSSADPRDASSLARHLDGLFALLSPAIGEDFYRSLVVHLTEACGVDYAMVGRLVGERRERIATLAVSHRGEVVQNCEYELRGTPCEDIVGKRLCSFGAGVAARFPADPQLVTMGIESYMGAPLFARDGSPLGLLALLHTRTMQDPSRLEAILRLVADRTAAELERELAVRSLRDSEARLAAVVDGSPGVAIQWYDRTGRVLRWNHGSETMFGFTAAEAIGHRLDELIHTPEELAGFLQALADIERTGQVIGPAEYTFRRRGGAQGVCWSTIFPIPGEEGAAWFVCMDIDVTKQKAAEAERARLTDQVRQAQKMESLGVLAGGVAHDFNNLLTSVLGNASLLRSELATGSKSHQLVAEIEGAACRAADLTRQMLAYAGRGSIVVEPFCLAAIVGEMAQLTRAVVSRRVELRLDLQPAVVKGDPTQVRQVVMNLITNAWEALAGRAGNVAVRTGRRVMSGDELHSPAMQVTLPPGEYAFVEVADDGAGMPAETLARIFEPFFSTKWKGRGLGLAAVLGIVRDHGGVIRVHTAPGQGTTMTVVLPLTDEPVAMHRPATDPTLRGGGRVLVIDDETDVRRVTRRLLEQAGYLVSEAASGPEGIAIVRADPAALDAVLIDLTMPRMDGWEVATQLHAIAPALPRVLMSGFADPRPANAHPAVSVAFVQKPFQAPDLVGALRAAMALSKP
ncbi:MAG: ATP-binding protein [Planctomycetota bacterium]